MKIISHERIDNQYDGALIDKLMPKFSFHEKRLITGGRMIKERHNAQMVFFVARVPPKQRGHTEYEGAKYWYRSMPREDFVYLGNNNQLIVNRPNDYLGIAPNYTYVSSPTYYGNDKKGTHIVEFEMSITGREFCDMLYAREKEVKGKKAKIHTPKGEGGGSIGLGTDGMYEGMAGVVFNEMLGEQNITWRLVSFRYANPLTNH